MGRRGVVQVEIKKGQREGGGEKQESVVETKILTSPAKPALKTVLKTSLHFSDCDF